MNKGHIAHSQLCFEIIYGKLSVMPDSHDNHYFQAVKQSVLFARNEIEGYKSK